MVCGKAGRERGGGWIVWTVKNSSGPGGAAGAHSAHKAGAGALGPRPCFGFAGLSGPQNAAAPRRNPTTPAYPRASALPPALGRLPGSAGRMGRSCGGAAAAFRGRGQRPRPLNMPAAGLARQRAGGRSPPAAAPPSRWVFHQRQKTQQKARPFVQPSPAPSTTRKKVVATASRCEGACNRAGEPSVPFSGEEPRRNERSPGKGTLPGPSGWSPRRRGQRRHKPPAAGCYPRATSPASARISPCA